MRSVICKYRIGNYVGDEYLSDHNDDVVSLASAAKRQHFRRRQRPPTTVLIESSG